MKVTLKGTEMALEGVQPKVGDQAPDFSLKNQKNEEVSLKGLLDKPVLISVVPDIDTSVCAIQTKKFNQEAGKLANIHFVTISNNTREQQADWCAAEGVDMQLLHDTDLSFAKAYGLFIPEFGHLARSIFVIDRDGKIVYEQIVPEIVDEPDYQAALKAAEALV